MKILIRHGQVLDPGAGLAQGCDIALAAGRIVGLNRVPPGFVPDRVLDADGCLVLPGLVDLAARLR
ncbi:dihydroorotase, partial [Verminephrobacter sp. Larva24]